jgi:hypothetical protein
MGNHEYCDECGASDFHFGRECNPERKAKHQKEREEIRKRNENYDRLTESTIKELRNLGFKAKKNQYGNIEIARYDLDRNLKSS